jgi:hypothetical protein
MGLNEIFLALDVIRNWSFVGALYCAAMAIYWSHVATKLAHRAAELSKA